MITKDLGAPSQTPGEPDASPMYWLVNALTWTPPRVAHFCVPVSSLSIWMTVKVTCLLPNWRKQLGNIGLDTHNMENHQNLEMVHEKLWATMADGSPYSSHCEFLPLKDWWLYCCTKLLSMVMYRWCKCLPHKIRKNILLWQLFFHFPGFQLKLLEAVEIHNKCIA